eukprot:gb/GEZN01001289.1/.p1 GENE.gb/GEZN01001289.1/~~gb/GEZN01001289.1/.p1  ORF type:complete len:979 (+),score=190.75 gb/GEZN01001289.1/:23-2959(+)
MADWLYQLLLVLGALLVGWLLGSWKPQKAAAHVTPVSKESEEAEELERSEVGGGLIKKEKDEQKQLAGIIPSEMKNTEKTETRRRLIIVSRELPINITKLSDGSWDIKWADSRNYISLRVLQKDMEVFWVGRPGNFFPQSDRASLETALAAHNCIPVFFEQQLYHEYYDLFCKEVMWPVFHYVLPHQNRSWSTSWGQLFQAFTRANMLMKQAVCKVMESPDDYIWIHNYHCMLVPTFIRRKTPQAKIGLFFHTPFPSSDVFRILPARANLLRGLLSCDIIGFHTYDYARHFLSTCTRLLNVTYKTLPGGLLGAKYSGRFVSVIVSHLGIDSSAFIALRNDPEVIARAKAIRKEHKDRCLIVAVDNLDAVKGSHIKMQAYQHFLQNNPDFVTKVTFLQVILPQAFSKQSGQALAQVLAEQADSIKKEFGDSVIDVVNRTDFDMSSTVCMYLASDVGIISTFWDGLNVNPYEYTVCQTPTNPGALILSESMGCSRSLSGVIRINPWNVEQLADAIDSAVNMDQATRVRQHSRRYKYVLSNSLNRWAIGFISSMNKACALNRDLEYVQVGWGSNMKLLCLRSDFKHLAKHEKEVQAAYRRSVRRLFLLDYDGTIIEDGMGFKGPDATLLRNLEELSKDPRNVVFILSGRQRVPLHQWFGKYKQLGLAAEKGCFIRWPKALMGYRDSKTKVPLRARTFKPTDLTSELDNPNSEQQTTQKLVEAVSLDDRIEQEIADEWELLSEMEDVTWKTVAIQILKSYTQVTDGAWIEDKEYGLVWHFERADPEYGRMQAHEAEKHLNSIMDNPLVHVMVYEFNLILEVKPASATKGAVATHILRKVMGGQKTLPLPGAPSAVGAKSIVGKTPELAEWPFILAMGDDVGDEDMYAAVETRRDLDEDYVPVRTKKSPTKAAEAAPIPAVCNPNTFSCCVGMKPSNARFYMQDAAEVRELINLLASTDNNSSATRASSTALADMFGDASDED